MKKLIIGILLLSVTLLMGCETVELHKSPVEEAIEDINESDLTLIDLTLIEPDYINFTSNYTWTEPDYSKEAYLKAYLGNKTKLIYFECVDGLLKLNETAIWCEKPGDE